LHTSSLRPVIGLHYDALYMGQIRFSWTKFRGCIFTRLGSVRPLQRYSVLFHASEQHVWTATSTFFSAKGRVTSHGKRKGPWCRPEFKSDEFCACTTTGKRDVGSQEAFLHRPYTYGLGRVLVQGPCCVHSMSCWRLRGQANRRPAIRSRRT
jgi:hypothetical protein